MPIQSATNCTNTELQTSKFKQKFQHRPVCKTKGAVCQSSQWLLAQHQHSTIPARLPICRARPNFNWQGFLPPATRLPPPNYTSNTLPKQAANWVPAQNCRQELHTTARLERCKTAHLPGFPAALARLPNYRQARHSNTAGLGCNTDLAWLQNCSSVRQSSNTARKGCKQSEKVAGPAPTLATIQASLPNCRARLQPANLPGFNTLKGACHKLPNSVCQSYNTKASKTETATLPTCQSFNAARLPNSLPKQSCPTTDLARLQNSKQSAFPAVFKPLPEQVCIRSFQHANLQGLHSKLQKIDLAKTRLKNCNSYNNKAKVQARQKVQKVPAWQDCGPASVAKLPKSTCSNCCIEAPACKQGCQNYRT